MSIFLNKNSSNDVVLTLSELVTLTGTDVYFLFRFISVDTKDDILFTGFDSSTNPIRYNRFTIVETGGTQNLTAATINMPVAGYWKYEAYQMTDPANLHLSGVTGGPIEYGKVFLSGSNLSQTQYVYSGAASLYTYPLNH
jgi:hypothetical protein